MNTPIRTAADFVSIDVHRCICGAQFCYACGQRWKTCLCPRWNENRLLCQLPVVAGRANNNDGVNDEPDDEDPEEESDEESDNDDESSDSEDDCQHEHWRYIQGRNVCEGCGKYYRRFLFECRDCRLGLCAKCRRELRQGQRGVMIQQPASQSVMLPRNYNYFLYSMLGGLANIWQT